jgi:hypothetical protein
MKSTMECCVFIQKMLHNQGRNKASIDGGNLADLLVLLILVP